MAAIGCLKPIVTGWAPTGVGSASSASGAPVVESGANALDGVRVVRGLQLQRLRQRQSVPLTSRPVAVALGSRTVRAAAVALEVTVAATRGRVVLGHARLEGAERGRRADA